MSDLNKAIQAGTVSSDIAPGDAVVIAASANPAATVNTAGANLVLAPGIGRRLFTVVSFAAGAGDTITLTVDGAATVLTEGVNFTAAVSNAATAASMAAAINTALATVFATVSGASVLVRKSRTVSSLVIATGDPAAWTVASGSDGSLVITGSLPPSPLPWTNTIWVDKSGNDGTALPGRADLPYLTIGAALAAALSGNAVIVRPGTYAEEGLTVPAGVSLIAEGSFRVTTVGLLAAVSSIITLSDGSYLQGFAVIVPTTVALSGVAHTAGTGTVYDIDFRGNGVGGLGDGIHKSGSGKVVGGNIRCSLGGMTNLLRVSAAVLALDNVHVPQSAGATANVVLTEGSGRFQGQGINVGNTNVTDCIHVAGTSTCIIYSPNWFNIPIGGHIAADGVTVTIVGGRIDATVSSLLIDGALSGTGTKLTVAGTTVQPLFSFPAAAITTMELNATFSQEQTDTRDAESRSVGAGFVSGFPELGSGISVGEGSPYSDGMVVFTTDGTAGPASDGAGFSDVSTEAASRSSSTFAFQAVSAGHSILWCTNRTDASLVPLKHWGLDINQGAVGAVLGGGSFIWEVQTAAGVWTEIKVMAVSTAEQYRYADAVFLRASSSEAIRPGIDDDTAWAATTISGTLGYWMRVRIASTITTSPTFERLRLIPSHVSTNARGQLSAKGLALWRKTLFGAGNMWGEGGGAADYTVTVGSGSAAAGETWSHKNKKGRINNSNDFVNFQYSLPGGICTAFPLKFRLLMSSTGAGNADMRMSVLPLEALNNLIADAAGGVAPVARTSADAYNANAAQVVDLATIATVTDTIQALTFDGFDISSNYEDDIIVIRVGFDPGGSAREVDIWALVIEGVSLTDGKIL